MDVARNIIDALARALAALDISSTNIRLERPSLRDGDYTTSLALAEASSAGTSPRELAQKIAAELGAIEGVERVEVAGPGYINFYLSAHVLVGTAEASQKDAWGSNDRLAGKTIMVEYTQPNPFKPFHIGHLMSNAIGESISRLVEYSSAHVIRANYQGDVGPHVAKAIWGVRQLNIDPSDADGLGRAYAHGAQAYENDAAAKEEIDAINKAVYAKSDEKINHIYDAGRAASLEHFEEIYKTLGTKFDKYFFESETAMRGKEIVEANPTVFPLSDGARVFKGEEHGFHTRVFLTSQGLPTYEAKELGLEYMKLEQFPDTDELIITTATEQKEYFNVVKATLAVLNAGLAQKLVHISHGMMRFADGKMSSRTGNVVTGESLLSDLIEAAKERAKESRADDHELLARQVAVAAIKYQILKQGSGKDIVFDRDRALSLEGDSGPYLQYAHARAHQITERAISEHVHVQMDVAKEPSELLRFVHRFSDAVNRASQELEPHLVTNYLLELASQFNSWYAQVHVFDSTPDVGHKVAIVNAVRATLERGLWLLGIPSPEKM